MIVLLQPNPDIAPHKWSSSNDPMEIWKTAKKVVRVNSNNCCKSRTPESYKRQEVVKMFSQSCNFRLSAKSLRKRAKVNLAQAKAQLKMMNPTSIWMVRWTTAWSMKGWWLKRFLRCRVDPCTSIRETKLVYSLDRLNRWRSSMSNKMNR